MTGCIRSNRGLRRPARLGTFVVAMIVSCGALAQVPASPPGATSYSPPALSQPQSPGATAAPASSAYGRQLSPIEEQIDRNVRTLSGGIETVFRAWEQDIAKPLFVGGTR